MKMFQKFIPIPFLISVILSSGCITANKESPTPVSTPGSVSIQKAESNPKFSFWGTYRSSNYELRLNSKDSFLKRKNGVNDEILWRGPCELESETDEGCIAILSIVEYYKLAPKTRKIKVLKDRNNFIIILHAESNKPMTLEKDFKKIK